MKVARNFPQQQHLHMIIMLVDCQKMSYVTHSENQKHQGTYIFVQKGSEDLKTTSSHLNSHYILGLGPLWARVLSEQIKKQVLWLPCPPSDSKPKPQSCRNLNSAVHRHVACFRSVPLWGPTGTHSEWSAEFGAFPGKRENCARAMQSFPKGSSATFQSQSEMRRLTKWP